MNVYEIIKSIVNVNNDQLDALKKYYDILIEESNKYNLTSIKELEEVYIKHYYDSLLLSKTTDLSKELSLLDIGSGAGFPGLVIKIIFPNLKITLVEPTLKRCNFLNLVINELGLKDIYVIDNLLYAPTGKYYTIYTIAGAVIANGITKEVTQLPDLVRGIYMIKVENTILKHVVKY